MRKQPNLYARLGLTKDASPEEIRKAYRQAARRLHPDVNLKPGETELFLGIKEAYDVLADPGSRANYDATLPPEEEDKPLKVNLLYSRTQLSRVDEPQLLYVLLKISPAENYFKDSAPPLNLCLVLDRSTSMQGARLDVVKRTALELLGHLNPQDHLSIVTFSDHAEVLLSAGSRLDREEIETRLRQMQAGGSTEIFRGLEAGLAELRRNYRRSAMSHLILLTDGQTYGDEADCLKLASTAAGEGTGISGLGVGSKWNDDFLDRLASQTGGESLYISRDEDIEQFLKNKFRTLAEIFAEGLTFETGLNPGVELRSIYRLKPDSGVLDPRPPIRLGSVPGAADLWVLLEFLIAPVNSTSKRITLAEGRLKFRILTRSLPSFAMPLTLDRPISDGSPTEAPPAEIVEAIRRVTLYHMQEKAQEEAKRGEFQNARRRLKNLATRLLSDGEPELAQDVINEAENLRTSQTLSEEGKKRIKYGTRNLFLQDSSRDTPG